MEVVSLGVEAVWSAQRYSRELADSVWSVRFYKHLLDVLAHDTWQSYPSEAFGRPCQFDRLPDFLASPDGLGWPTVPEVLEMIGIVSRCNPPTPPRKNEPADPPITEWARQALDALAPHVTLKSAQAQAAKAQPLAEHRRPTAGEQEANKVANGHLRLANKLSSNSQERILRRIARDQPELLDQIGPDKPHRSARAAAIAAGIIKPVPTVRLVDDPAKVAASIRRHLSQDQIEALVMELSSA
jgi:hypothetical protein